MKKLWRKIKHKIWIIRYTRMVRFRKNKRSKPKLNFHKQFWIVWLSFVIIALIAGYFLLPQVFNFYGLAGNPSEIKEYHSQIVRNLGWLVWMVLSFLGLSIGLDLAIWGRIIQHKSHLQERYEKAASMLGNEVMPVRVAGCRALMSLGMEDKSMKIQCVRLLFSFIADPYLKSEYQGVNLNKVFLSEEPLRPDIQEAIDSFSAIYNHYGKKGIDSERVILPYYFWINKCKGNIRLIKVNLSFAFKNMRKAYLFEANLQGSDLYRANLQKADLTYANLQKTCLSHAELRKIKLVQADLQEADLCGAYLQKASLTDANLQKANLRGALLQGAYFGEANLRGADLSYADITNAEMEFAKNLTKKQILSAIWGIDKAGKGSPPSLPDELKNDVDVQKWLATPYYNKKKIAEEMRKSYQEMQKTLKDNS